MQEKQGGFAGMRAESMLPFSEPGREEIQGVGWGGVGRGRGERGLGDRAGKFLVCPHPSFHLPLGHP